MMTTCMADGVVDHTNVLCFRPDLESEIAHGNGCSGVVQS